jgi:hypothetical protein
VHHDLNRATGFEELGERARVERRDVSFVDRAAVHRIERLLDAS